MEFAKKLLLTFPTQDSHTKVGPAIGCCTSLAGSGCYQASLSLSCQFSVMWWGHLRWATWWLIHDEATLPKHCWNSSQHGDWNTSKCLVPLNCNKHHYVLGWNLSFLLWIGPPYASITEAETVYQLQNRVYVQPPDDKMLLSATPGH